MLPKMYFKKGLLLVVQCIFSTWDSYCVPTWNMAQKNETNQKVVLSVWSLRDKVQGTQGPQILFEHLCNFMSFPPRDPSVGLLLLLFACVLLMSSRYVQCKVNAQSQTTLHQQDSEGREDTYRNY